MRELLRSISAGIISSVFCEIFGYLVKLKNKYVVYVIAYIGVILSKVAVYVFFQRGFPVNLYYWVYDISVLVLTASIVIIGIYFTRRSWR